MVHSPPSGNRQPGISLIAACLVAATVATNPAHAQQIEWTRQFGDGDLQTTTWVADVKTAGGFVYVAGTTSSLTAIDGFVRKLDPAGNLVWERAFGTFDYDEITVLAVNGTDVFVGGITYGEFPGQTDLTFFTPDAFLARFDTDGNPISAVQMPRLSPEGFGTPYPAFIDASGVYGTDLVASPASDADVQVFKYDLGGNLLWATVFGSPGDDRVSTAWPRSLSVDSGGVSVTGYTSGAFPGQTLAGFADALLARLDLAGNLLWVRQQGTANATTLGAGVASDGGGIYVSGTTAPGAEPPDVFVSRFDLAGNHLWTRGFGTAVSDAVLSGIAANPTGVCVAGATDGVLAGQANAGAHDVFARKYDPSGNEIWTFQLGSAGSDDPYAVFLDGLDAFVGGTAQATLPGQTAPNGAFVLKIGTPVATDSDGDGLTDADETARGTDPNNPDTDADGLSDGAEVALAGSGACPSPLDPDSDGDGIADATEVDSMGTSPCSIDTDSDGLPDSLDPYPLLSGLDPDVFATILERFATMTAAMPLDRFVGSTAHAKKMKRHAMALSFHAAAHLADAGHLHASRMVVRAISRKIDGATHPQDWMVPSPEKSDVAAAVSLLISLMGGGGCGG